MTVSISRQTLAESCFNSSGSNITSHCSIKMKRTATPRDANLTPPKGAFVETTAHLT